MKLTRKSELTGTVSTREIDITQEALDRWEMDRPLIQNAFPQLSDDDREFILTGITPEEWELHMRPPDEPN